MMLWRPFFGLTLVFGGIFARIIGFLDENHTLL